MTTSRKPSATHDYSLTTTDGHSITVHQGGPVCGAWLSLPGQDHTLLLCSEPAGNYVGYRDGKVKEADKLAIAVDDRGAVTIQVVLPGGDENVRTITLDRLEELVAAEPPPLA